MLWLARPTDEVEGDAAVAEAAGGAVEEGLGVVGVDEAVVARVR